MSNIRGAFYGLALALLLAVVTACASSGEPVQGQTGPVAPPSGQGTHAAPSGVLTINGAGGTFPYPLYSRWFYEYAKADPNVHFNYAAIGSGGGIAQITAKTVDFGASDAILNDQQLQKAPGLQMFPTVAGAVIPSYNLKDADGKPITAAIKFPRGSLANIYLGKIIKWNDPVLQNANPDIKLPNKDIIVVHRSDGSGTTFIFTDYLSKTSPEWQQKVGNSTSVQWPTGLGGKGNDGVAGVIAQNEGALGYIEFAYALQNKLAYGIVQNKAGDYVPASTQSVQSAMADFGTDLGSKLAVSIVDAPGKGSWPIAGYTYLLLYLNQTDCSKAQNLVSFMKWAYGDGTQYATQLEYIPLPDAVKQQVQAKLGQITCNGKPL